MQKYPARRRAVASVLRQTRMRAGYSQRRLSAELGEVVNYCHMIEKGRQAVPMEEFIAWAKACGANPVALMRKVLAQNP